MSTILSIFEHPAGRARAGLGVGDGLLGHDVVDQVFDREHQARLAGDGRAIGQPAGAAAHRLDHEVHAAGLGVGEQVADLARQELDRGEVAEREVDSAVVVVDRLGNVHDGDSRGIGAQVVLEPLELVGGLQGVVAADRYQGVDAQRCERPMDRPKLGRPLGIGQMRRVRDVLARVGARRADHDPACVARSPQVALVEDDVIAAFLHRVVVAELDQVGVAMQNAQHFDAMPAKRCRRGRDHRIGRGSRAAGEQDGHATDLPRRSSGIQNRGSHGRHRIPPTRFDQNESEEITSPPSRVIERLEHGRVDRILDEPDRPVAKEGIEAAWEMAAQPLDQRLMASGLALESNGMSLSGLVQGTASLASTTAIVFDVPSVMPCQAAFHRAPWDRRSFARPRTRDRTSCRARRRRRGRRTPTASSQPAPGYAGCPTARPGGTLRRAPAAR